MLDFDELLFNEGIDFNLDFQKIKKNLEDKNFQLKITLVEELLGQSINPTFIKCLIQEEKQNKVYIQDYIY